MRRPSRSRFVAMVLLACVVGLHWALLQLFAWTGMLLRYSCDLGIREAIVRTFDGHHPCALCLAVKAGRTADRDREGIVSSARWEAVVPASEVVLIFIADGCTPYGREVDGGPRFYPPPKPRPRLAAGSLRCHLPNRETVPSPRHDPEHGILSSPLCGGGFRARQ